MTKSSVYFISDAHLGVPIDGSHVRQAHLISFLDTVAERAKEVVIVGDLFDFWIEYEGLIRSEYFDVLCALAALRRRGVRIHYVAGNHDFALGPFLTDQLGIVVHSRAYSANIHGQRLYVAHGDGMRRFDVSYRLFRPLLRNRVSQRLYKLLHPSLGIALASKVSWLSRRLSGGALSAAALHEYRSIARRILDRGNDIVIFAHTHLPEHITGESKTYCNVGEWIRQYNYAVLEGGRLSLWRYEPDADPVRIQPRPWK